MEYIECIIRIIRDHLYYETGALERMSEAEIKAIYEALLDWIED